ncbi:unnamed protein product [Owenia fusiformis]|uniref:Uncharacterized protein n=1 Tax=Owenia fusiformis TaxID=6347 RepID=A0A8J1TKK5_OWEFU|nr:unnamed protein product [Owenia fusiformis]
MELFLSLWTVCFILVDLLYVTFGFNVDLRLPVIHKGQQQGSYFGYSVAQHIDRNNNWLLVGAPLTQTGQEQIVKGGAVLRCKVNRANDCQPIPFDLRGNNIQWNGRDFVQMEDKSNQWFGATVHSSGRDGKIVACAPRYVYFSQDLNRREPVGTCYTSSSTVTEFREYSPCRNEYWGYHRQGSCQTGLSAVLTSDGSHLIMGAVGSHYWQGQIFAQSLNRDDTLTETPERDASEDDTLMGYSIATGEFTGNNAEDYVTGIPKGGQLKGQIVIFDDDLDQLRNITGDQIGSYFGSSLAASDFNGDGFDDFAVGAPFYTEEFGQKEEVGRVYIYYQTKRNKFKPHKSDILVGFASKSRFGMSLAAIGDINNDKFKDLAIGAPYGGEDGNGAVYFFHGSSKGIQEKHSQVIYAADVHPSIKTFGWSIAGGYDMDSNFYPDVLVGAYASDNAVLLKTRPIIRITTEVTIVPQIINLENKMCTLASGDRVTCVSITTCMTYTGLGVPQQIELYVDWKLDPEKNVSRRVYYLNKERQYTESKTIRLFKTVKWCNTTNVYIKNNIRDKLSPIDVDVNYRLREDTFVRRRKFLIPILDSYIPTTTRGSAQTLKNCGEDNVCIPDLIVTAEGITKEHIHGNTNPVDLRVAVKNIGEDAFEAQLTLHLPHGTKYTRIFDVSSLVSVSCTSVELEEGNFVVCDIGNPLPGYQNVAFTISVSPSQINSTVERLRFLLQANSSNVENQTLVNDNYALADIPVTASARIQLTGVSKPEQLIYNTSQITHIQPTIDTHIGPQLIHLFEVRNFGPSTIASTQVEILWPSQFETGGHLFYLTEIPQIIIGNGECTTDVVNPANVSVTISGEDEVSALLKAKLESSRQRRAVGDDLAHRLRCTSKWCSIIMCRIRSMEKGENALIQVRSRLWLNSFNTKERQQSVVISSEALAQVMRMPYKVKPTEYSLDTTQVSTYVGASDVKPQSKSIAIWIIIVAAIAGLLLLILLVICFWKCGFFKRRKHEDQDEMIPEKEKMNPNQEISAGQNGKNGHDAGYRLHYYGNVHDDEL